MSSILIAMVVKGGLTVITFGIKLPGPSLTPLVLFPLLLQHI